MRFVTAAGVVGLVLAAAACGGGGGATTAPTSAASTGAQATAASTAQAQASTAPDPTGAGSGSSADACSLVTLDEAKAAAPSVTRSVPASSPNEAWASAACGWYDASGAEVFTINVGDKASIAASSDGLTAADVVKAVKAGFDESGDGSGEYEMLSGVGDSAIYAGANLTAARGGSALNLYTVSSQAMPKETQVTLVKAALGRLP